MGRFWRQLPLLLGGFVSLFGVSYGVLITQIRPVYHVPSISMSPAYLQGTYVVGAKWPRHNLRDGEVVLLHEPLRNAMSLRRVVGLPGETVACCDNNGGVTRNGISLVEPYVGHGQDRPFGPVTVPPGQVFLLGDNRMLSVDSRLWGPGSTPAAIDQSAVVGRASPPKTPVNAYKVPLLLAGGVASTTMALLVLLVLAPRAWRGRVARA